MIVVGLITIQKERIIFKYCCRNLISSTHTSLIDYEKFGISDQISEKTILPLIQGCPIFLTSDGKLIKN